MHNKFHFKYLIVYPNLNLILLIKNKKQQLRSLPIDLHVKHNNYSNSLALGAYSTLALINYLT